MRRWSARRISLSINADSPATSADSRICFGEKLLQLGGEPQNLLTGHEEKLGLAM